MNSKSLFENVIIIGYGQTVNKCIKYLSELRSAYKYELTYVEYESTSLSTSKDICEKENVNYCNIESKSDLTTFFLEIEKKTLIISAGNFYIFPKEVVEKDNLTIINFHSALLPKYPGRNAQTWAIFMDEKEAGATWHYVNEELDAGKYIIQKSCSINDDTRAFELTGAIMDVAYEGFVEIIEGVLQDKYDKVQTVFIDPDRKVYKGKDIPGDGVFNLFDNPKYIYKLLRATDYGKSDIFPQMITEVNGEKVRITNYKKIENNMEKLKININSSRVIDTYIDEKQIIIPFDEEYVLRLKYKSV